MHYARTRTCAHLWPVVLWHKITWTGVQRVHSQGCRFGLTDRYDQKYRISSINQYGERLNHLSLSEAIPPLPHTLRFGWIQHRFIGDCSAGGLQTVATPSFNERSPWKLWNEIRHTEPDIMSGCLMYKRQLGCRWETLWTSSIKLNIKI
jgi:hypothetical protein